MPTLHVCTTCRAGQPLPEDGIPAGQHMFDAIAAQAGPGLCVLPVKCLSSCDHGPTGTVLPSKRPASLAKMVLGRMPDLAPAFAEAAE